MKMSRLTKTGDLMKLRTAITAGILAAILCLWFAGSLAARAEDVRVSAALADDTTDVGQPVDFTITVKGATTPMCQRTST